MTRHSRPPARPDLYCGEQWSVAIEPVDMLPFGRWRVYLTRGMVVHGLDAWGWTCWTLNGAHRKGARELARLLRREDSLERRRRQLRTAPSAKPKRADRAH